MINNIKRILGFCECKGCWNRAEFDLEIKGTKIKKSICSNCVETITLNATRKEIELKDGTKITIE